MEPIAQMGTVIISSLLRILNPSKVIHCEILAASKRVETGLPVPEMRQQQDISTAAGFFVAVQSPRIN